MKYVLIHLTALLQVENGELITNPFFYRLMEQVFQEVAFLVKEEVKKCYGKW